MSPSQATRNESSSTRRARLEKLREAVLHRKVLARRLPAAFNGRYVGEPNDPSSLRPAIVLARLTTEDGQPIVAGPITDGTQIHRAQNDVGGLLDTSKGWTLSIPMPNETAAATQRIADSQAAPPATASAATQNDAATQSRVIASR